MPKETESEKLVKDTLHHLQETGQIVYGHKIVQLGFRGQGTPGAVDFLMVLNDGRTVLLEVKEAASTNIQYSRFSKKTRQRAVVAQANDCLVVVRFYNGNTNRGSDKYYELYHLLPPRTIPMDKSGSVRMSECPVAIAGQRVGRRVFGLSDDAGLSTRGNPTQGIIDFLPAVERALKN
jgi:hypothetical protein